MVPGLDASAGRPRDRSKYFSLPFSSTIVTVIGRMDLNAVAVALSYSVAVKVLVPILIFILLPVGFASWLLLFAVLVAVSFFSHDAQPERRKNEQKTSMSNCFIKISLLFLNQDVDFCYPILNFE